MTMECKYESKITEMYEMTLRQDEKINAMHKALMGNGRPGLLEQWHNLKGQINLLKIFTTSGILTGIISIIITILKTRGI